VKFWRMVLLTLPLVAGCAALNDSLVRTWHQDRSLSNRVNRQIREGLERRLSAPERVSPKTPAPAFQDQG
jgi:hypothetical protein